MISNTQLETRIFQYLDALFKENAIDYGFDADNNKRYIVERQTGAPRPKADTVLYYRIETNEIMGGNRGRSRSIQDRNTNKESVEAWKNVVVVCNILSKQKGLAKDAFNFLTYATNSERDYNASVGTGNFDLLLHRVGEQRNLTALENESWTERVELDMYFNYTETVELDDVQFTQEPATVEDVKDIVGITNNIKQGE